MWQATIYPMPDADIVKVTEREAPIRGQRRESRKEARIELIRMVRQFITEVGVDVVHDTFPILKNLRAGESVYLWTADYGEEFAQAGVYLVHMNGA